MTPAERSALLERYRTGTAAALDALAGSTEAELDRTPATADDWTPRQIAHHLADSESMAYIRLRRLIAEDDPTDPSSGSWRPSRAVRPSADLRRRTIGSGAGLEG